MKGTYLGEFEELVLLTIGALFEGAYGVAIKSELEKQTNRRISIGAVHAAVNRLQDKGFLDANFGKPTSERGGKRKKFYKVTTHGQHALKEAMEIRQKMWRQIPSIAFEIKPKEL